MAFPTIQTGDTKNGTVTSNSTSWTLTYPTNLVSGDLILAFVSTDGSQASITPPANWHYAGVNQSAAVQGLCMFKISDGTETGNFTLTLASSEQGAWRVFRITSWFAGSIPTTDLIDGSLASSDSLYVAAWAGGASSTPDPPACDPASWATEDTLWLAACMVDTSRTISVYPLADNNTADVSGGAGGATLGVCRLNDTVASKDPDTFTISASDDWVAATVAVRPAAGPTNPPPLLTERMNVVYL